MCSWQTNWSIHQPTPRQKRLFISISLFLTQFKTCAFGNHLLWFLLCGFRQPTTLTNLPHPIKKTSDYLLERFTIKNWTKSYTLCLCWSTLFKLIFSFFRVAQCGIKIYVKKIQTSASYHYLQNKEIINLWSNWTQLFLISLDFEPGYIDAVSGTG